MSRYGLLLLTLCLACGCSTTATIITDSKVIKGEIVGSEISTIHILLEPAPDSVFRERKSIERSEIAEIDHPGIEHAVVATLFVLGSTGLCVGGIDSIVQLKSSGDQTDDDDDYDGLAKAFGTVSAGLMIGFGLAGFLASTPVAIWGWVTWGGSRSRAAPPDNAHAGASQENLSEDLHLETGGWRPETAIRFLGIAPVASGDRDMKGMVVGFQF